MKNKSDTELINLAREGSCEALEEIAVRYDRLRHHIANKVAKGDSNTEDDYYMETYFGIHDAIAKYKEKMGQTFMQFLAWKMYYACLSYYYKEHGLITIPKRYHSIIHKINLYMAKNNKESLSNDDIQIIADEEKKNIEFIKKCYEIALLSKVQSLGDDDYIYGMSCASSEMIELEAYKGMLNDAIDMLNKEDARIICMIYGLRGYDSHSLSDMAKMLGYKSKNSVIEIRKSIEYKLSKLMGKEGIYAKK